MMDSATPAQKEARDRMALFPVAKGGHGSDGQGGERSEVLFVEEDKWVPVLRLGGKVCVTVFLSRSKRGGIECGIGPDGTAMRVPRYPELVPAALAGLDTVPAYSAGFFQAV